MLDSLTIKNFETHLNTKIDLHSGVNTIIGDSDEGKSGIVRAIRWNAANRPQGDDYRNDKLDPKKKEDKLKKTEVGIAYKDSGLVIRARDGVPSGINHYTINNEEPLRALRTDVPNEVQEVTRMKTVNIQGQHPSEQYFLLVDKPGQVAKQFNKVAGLTIMDKAISDINSQVRSCNHRISTAKEEIENKEKEVRELDWVPKAEKFFKKLKNFKDNLLLKKQELDSTKEQINLAESIDKKLQKWQGTKKALKALSELEKEQQTILDQKNKLYDLSETISNIKLLDSELSNTTDTTEALRTLKMLKIKKQRIKDKKTKIKTIRQLIKQFKELEGALTIAEKEYKSYQEKFQIMKKETICPTCGRTGNEL